MENLWKVFSRIRRLRGKYLSEHEEYDEVRVVCGTQTLNQNQIVGPKNPFPDKIGPNPLLKK
jgi:hypothetical protein